MGKAWWALSRFSLVVSKKVLGDTYGIGTISDKLRIQLRFSYIGLEDHFRRSLAEKYLVRDILKQNYDENIMKTVIKSGMAARYSR